MGLKAAEIEKRTTEICSEDKKHLGKAISETQETDYEH
jgi:hypothetical protein